jgi:RNA polymerase sigma-70 factor (ECF subfamily)
MTVTVDVSSSDQRDHVLDTLISGHAKALLAYTETLLNDHYLAEDIVQETLIRAWRHTDRLYSTKGSIRGWLLTVARNLAIDWLRSAAFRHESVGAEDQDVSQPDHADAVAGSAQAVDLLRGLSPEHREVLFHMYMRGKTLRETAQILGVPVGTVKSRQHYALAVLRSRRIKPGR